MVTIAGTLGSVLSADGTRIGYVTAGDGPALLLVHGGMASRLGWAPVWPRLVNCFRVTAMDRRGRGSSTDGARPHSLDAEYADVAAVANAIRSGPDARVDVFGHSYGATCVLGAAAGGAPLRRVALYEPPGPQTVPAEWVSRAAGWIAAGEPGRAMWSFLVEVIGLTPKQVESMRDTAADQDWAQIVSTTLPREAKALAGVDLPALAARISQPVLMLLGADSPPWAEAITYALHRGIPDARAEVTVLAGQGHQAIDQAPDLVVDQLARFFGHSEDVDGADRKSL